MQSAIHITLCATALFSGVLIGTAHASQSPIKSSKNTFIAVLFPDHETMVTMAQQVSKLEGLQKKSSKLKSAKWKKLYCDGLAVGVPLGLLGTGFVNALRTKKPLNPFSVGCFCSGTVVSGLSLWYKKYKRPNLLQKLTNEIERYTTNKKLAKQNLKKSADSLVDFNKDSENFEINTIQNEQDQQIIKQEKLDNIKRFHQFLWQKSFLEQLVKHKSVKKLEDFKPFRTKVLEKLHGYDKYQKDGWKQIPASGKKLQQYNNEEGKTIKTIINKYKNNNQD